MNSLKRLPNLLAAAVAAFLILPVAVAQTPAVAPAPAASAQPEFLIHAFHKDKLGGELDCSLCHVAVKEGSVTLKRPGHDQCITCHSDDFNKDLNQKVCSQCHNNFPPTGDDLVPFPRYKGSRTILFDFSHNKHVDAKARIDARTGFRADCTFCHKFDPKGQFATFPGHEQCAACHSKPGMKPQLTADLSAAGCRGCHTPEEIENPGFTEARRFAG
ncbi:MAG: cytochrome c3 family protein, partial [Acidobacteriota bacterium]|nr:cytochrome c3 family protein [Acidobacteriota bacterium]